VIAAGLLVMGALLLGASGVAEILRGRSKPGWRRVQQDSPPTQGLTVRTADQRLGLSRRLARAGLGDRISASSLLAAKLGGAIAGLLWGVVIAPAAPGRLAFLIAAALPVAGFAGPDIWLERLARLRLRSLRSRLPDALDLLAVGTAAGRSPIAGLTELGGGDGPLGRELAVLSAESACGLPQREALESLCRRAPVPEVAAMCGVIERSRRFGSPLSEQLHEQAAALRGAQRRRIEEQAARAAPKIQLAVALLLVPSVLLMIAAGLLANVDRFMAGI
jgi:tight adherence protein C